MTTPRLPEDVWRSVAALLPRSDLLRLASLNRAFHAVALDERFRHVRWENTDDATLQSLERLKAPRIAGRVRRLDIGAAFLQKLVQSQQGSGSKPVASGLLGRMTQWIQGSLPTRILFPTLPPAPSGSAILSAMTEAVPLMTNVVECSAELRAFSVTPETASFLAAAHSAFGNRFRRLALSARLCDFPSMLDAVDFVEELEDLDLTFEYDLSDDPSASGPSAALLRDEILPFISRFASSLRTLSITAISKVDIGPLFEALPRFDNVEKLTVRLNCGFLDAAAVMSVLDAHTDTLSAVEISAQCQSTSLAIWRALAGRPILARLRSLVLGYESHVFECIRAGSASSSSRADRDRDASLAISRRPFSESDNLWEPQLETVLKTLAALGLPMDSSSHTKLRIGVFDLTPRVFALLVRYLPSLHTLNIVVYAPTYRTDWIAKQLEDVARDWRLAELAIWDFDSGSPAAAMPQQMEKLVGEVVKRLPSVQTSNSRPTSAAGQLYGAWGW
uniref:F-box domain-containing protein n=1 Tax=Mycena chlorophos TaxID=658473 RepID=A0ABQ0L2F4_MYCCL|nr:predicted protein [Mycena chlorophos]